MKSPSCRLYWLQHLHHTSAVLLSILGIRMRRKASRNNKNAMHAIENTCKQKQNGHTLIIMVGWEKPVTRYNKNNNNKNNNKNLHCHMHKECSTYAGDREWLNARGKKSLRSARWHLCSLLLRSLALSISIVTVQRSLPIVLVCTVLYNDLYHYQC